MDIMTLLMAQRGGGTGGGSVNSVNGVKPDGAGNVALKHDDLEERPFYSAVEPVTFVDNKTFTSAFESNYNAFAVALGMVLEQMPRTSACVVTWDGVTRTHNPIDLDLGVLKATAYGNVGALGVGQNTGEPYVLLYLTNGAALFFTTDTAPTSHTITIKADATVYHTMEQVYVGVPTIDFVEMGLPDVPNNATDTVTCSCNGREIRDLALENSVVKVRYRRSQGEGADVLEYLSTALITLNLWNTSLYLNVLEGRHTVFFRITETDVTAGYS